MLNFSSDLGHKRVGCTRHDLWMMPRGGRGGLAIVDYTRKIYPKGVPFLSWQYTKGYRKLPFYMWKGHKIGCKVEEVVATADFSTCWQFLPHETHKSLQPLRNSTRTTDEAREKHMAIIGNSIILAYLEV